MKVKMYCALEKGDDEVHTNCIFLYPVDGKCKLLFRKIPDNKTGHWGLVVEDDEDIPCNLKTWRECGWKVKEMKDKDFTRCTFGKGYDGSEESEKTNIK